MARNSRNTLVIRERKRTRGHTGAHGDRLTRRTWNGFPAGDVTS